VRYYKSHSFPVPKYRISIYLLRIRIKKDFDEGFSSSTTKEIVTIKDDSYYFAENLEFGGYKNPSEKGDKKASSSYC